MTIQRLDVPTTCVRGRGELGREGRVRGYPERWDEADVACMMPTSVSTGHTFALPNMPLRIDAVPDDACRGPNAFAMPMR